ncbi:MAG: hypothetical protein IID42_03170 [Planctomycetes bacterium]|nr:hypothetical protein [Planctomycetota bacterium]
MIGVTGSVADPYKKGLAKAFAARAREIATNEGLSGRPIADYVKLVNRCNGNLRMVFTEIEAGVML